MIYKIIADYRPQTEHSPVYYIRGNSKKQAKERFAITGLKIYSIEECTPKEAEQAEKEQRILFECQTKVKHIYQENGQENLYLSLKEKKILREARQICLEVYEETKHDVDIEQTADDIQDGIEKLLNLSLDSEEWE